MISSSAWFIPVCLFRLRVAGDVVAILVFYMVDIMMTATEGATKVIFDALNQRFPSTHIVEVEWYMGTEYERDREKGNLAISKTPYIRTELNHLNFSKDKPNPATPSVYLEYESEQEAVVDMSFQGIVGSLV